ncbi:MAG: hypothetical protein COW79_07670 [Bdellovibrionales bacterium CG22_combo_CG10-13_8_21_14_all_38_13]|nr:MAG: hypothetical protein COW79_07670 [Bdellovibrionales bacterium CG22_combo_CG10-13_8_21_14_all_38_13]
MLFRFVIIISIFLHISSGYAKDVFTIGTFPYPPYHSEKGGFLNDLYIAIFKAVDYEVEFKYLPIRRSESNFLKGDIDFFSSHVLIDNKNLKLVEKLNIFKFSSSFFYLKTKGSFEDLKSLNGFICGVIHNTPYEQLYKINGIQLNYLKDPQTLLKMVLLDRVTAFEATFLTGINYIRRNELVEKFDYFIFDVLPSGPAILKTSKKRKKIVELVTKGYELIIKNGELVKILEKYWGKDNIPKAVLPNDIRHLGKDSPQLNLIPLSI